VRRRIGGRGWRAAAVGLVALGLSALPLPVQTPLDPSVVAGPQHRQLLPVAARSLSLRSASPRYGVVVGKYDDDAAIQNALNRLGLHSWYTYGYGANGPSGRAQLVGLGINAVPPSADPSLQAVARARPGSYWIVGNEPNVPGLDWDPRKDLAQNAAEMAALYRRYRQVILAADPTARFVIGNQLNMDLGCVGCTYYTPGREFLDAFRRAYRDAYGEEPPADVWNIHVYKIDWERLPMTATDELLREFQSFRTYIDAIPGHAGKPIWVGELGVIWGYPRYCFEGEKVTPCGTSFADQAVETYINSITSWLDANASALKIERWFLFSSFSLPDGYATVAGGIRLLDGSSASARLTRFGELYRQRAVSGSQ
jgi:hypothetical protein